MKFLILSALVAVASAQLSGVEYQLGKKGVLLQQSTFAAQPQFQYAKIAAEPLHYNPFAAPTTFNKQFAVKSAAAPVYSQYKQYNQYNQYNPFVAQSELLNKQYAIKSTYSPYLAQQSAYTVQKPSVVVKQFSQEALPVYSHEFAAAHKLAQPTISQRVYQDSLATYPLGHQAALRILSQEQEADPAGNYKLSFATENGIQTAEQGALVNGAEGPVVASQGAYSYTAPDGVQYTVNWVADENGYRASGAHLPQAPAIPDEIQRSIAFNANNPEKYDDQGKLIK